jgi:hypothetical protein
MRWRLAATCLATAVVAAAGATAALFLLTPPGLTVLLDSVPSGATAFSPDLPARVTPCRIELKPGERRELRLVRKGFKDAHATLDARDFIPGGWRGALFLRSGAERPRTIRLEAAAQAGLVVTTTPAGADVFLDGDRVGASPLSLRSLTPGRRLLRLAHAQCFPVSEEITLLSGEVTRLDRALENRTEAFYRERMRSDPGELLHHAELIHHFVVNGEAAKATEAIQTAYDLTGKPGAKGHAYFYQELHQIYTRYYAWPDAAAPKLRPLCRKLMKSASEGPSGSETARKLLERLDQYDAQNPGK